MHRVLKSHEQSNEQLQVFTRSPTSDTKDPSPHRNCLTSDTLFSNQWRFSRGLSRSATQRLNEVDGALETLLWGSPCCEPPGGRRVEVFVCIEYRFAPVAVDCVCVCECVSVSGNACV